MREMRIHRPYVGSWQHGYLLSVRRQNGANLMLPHASFSARAKTAIQNELARFPDDETGGLLLGYADAEHIAVLEATDGGYENTIHEPDCFAYDPAYEKHLCGILSELFDPPLQLVGLWHKHNQSGRSHFSRADEDMHRQLLESAAYPCISLLFEKEGRDCYDAHVFLLRAENEHADITNDTDWV